MEMKENNHAYIESHKRIGGKRRDFLKLACVLPAFFFMGIVSEGKTTFGSEEFTIWQLPSQTGVQMMSYVLQFGDGTVVVVDGGWEKDGRYLKRFLTSLGGRVDAWFITHPHKDHISALTWILQSSGGLEIKNIYASFPSMEWLRKYDSLAPGLMEDFILALAAAEKTYTVVNIGDIFDIDDVRFEILSCVNPEITVNAVNNSSLTFRVSGRGKTILFTGDIGAEASRKILENVDHQKLKADYIQMTHHGQSGATRRFYEVVDPQYCLWPTPLWLWNNDKSGGGYNSGPWTTLETRQWVSELGVTENYVSGLSGLIEIK